jgi:aldose 1-epimerase
MPRRYAFGELEDGSKVDAIEIGSGDSVRARVLTYGANLAALWVPCSGRARNIVLGHTDLEPYLRSGPANGAIIGRYANRIAGGQFRLDGRVVDLDVNLPPHTIHGGSVGFAKKIWQAELEGDTVVMTLHSPDGDQGFPSSLDVVVRYQVSDRGLLIDYTATTGAPTVVNLTNHVYFNLSGNGSIRDHRISIVADHVLEATADGIPTGALKPVSGTPLDLRVPTLLADVIDLPDAALRQFGGFDHHYVFSRPDIATPVATAMAGGLRLDLSTSEPGMQFYTGNFLKPPNSALSGFCFETQHAPDSPNHPSFPSTVLRPGLPFRSRTEFSVRSEH